MSEQQDQAQHVTVTAGLASASGVTGPQQQDQQEDEGQS
jgi:hypothetical protein